MELKKGRNFGTLSQENSTKGDFLRMPGKDGAELNAGRRKDIMAVLAIVLFYAGLEAIGITCPILFLTGVSCAGCGMSRAWMALLRLDVAAAFRYHPLFWLPVPAAAAWLFRKRIPRKVWRALAALLCALFLGVYLARLFSPEDTVVVWEPSRGLLCRLLSGGRKG